MMQPLARLPELSATSEGPQEAEGTAGMMCPEVKGGGGQGGAKFVLIIK